MKKYCNRLVASATCLAATLVVAIPEARAAVYTFTTFDASTQLGGPAGVTYASGINNAGQIVGSYASSGNSNGFILSGGTFTRIDVPNSQDQSTQVSGINNSGQITGTFNDNGTGSTHGFVTSDASYGNAGSYAQLDAPFANVGGSVGATNGFGLNNNGQVVGGTSLGGPATQHGFTTSNSGTTFTQIDVTLPGAAADSTQALGVNDLGHIVGSFLGPNGHFGFLDIAGVFTQLDAPFATVTDMGGPHGGETFATGINNAGTIVGYVRDGIGAYHGFRYDGGVYTEIDVPSIDGTDTQVLGVNDSGALVGIFAGNDFGMEGFVATLNEVPEPASLTVLGIALAGLAGACRGRGRQRGSAIFKAG